MPQQLPDNSVGVVTPNTLTVTTPLELEYVKKSIRWLTLKRPGNLTPAEQKALEVVKQAIPELAVVVVN